MPGSRLSNLPQERKEVSWRCNVEICIKSSRRPLGRKMSSAGSVFRPNLPALVPREFILSKTSLQLLLPSGQAFPSEWSKQVAPFSPAVSVRVCTNPSDDCQKKVRPEERLSYAMPLPEGAKDIRRPKPFVANWITSPKTCSSSSSSSVLPAA